MQHFKKKTTDSVFVMTSVVRCKDCKYYVKDEALLGSVCKRLFTIFPMKPDDFCSYGESAGRGHE